ncbi:MAG TPA: hypothetical protein VGM01_04505 [Ktedonobacteraceae bacterium]
MSGYKLESYKIPSLKATVLEPGEFSAISAREREKFVYYLLQKQPEMSHPQLHKSGQ